MLFYLNHRGKEFKRFIDINSKCFSIKTLYGMSVNPHTR